MPQGHSLAFPFSLTKQTLLSSFSTTFSLYTLLHLFQLSLFSSKRRRQAFQYFNSTKKIQKRVNQIHFPFFLYLLKNIEIIYNHNFLADNIIIKKISLLSDFRKIKKMMRENHQDQQSKMICELSSLVFNLLLQSSPAPLSYSDRSPIVPVHPSVLRRSSAAGQITPAGFASFVLGISVALMLCGSVTFVIGFMLMPWVIGLVMVLYVAGIVSSLSVLGRYILCFASPRKDSPEWKLL